MTPRRPLPGPRKPYNGPGQGMGIVDAEGAEWLAELAAEADAGRSAQTDARPDLLVQIIDVLERYEVHDEEFCDGLEDLLAEIEGLCRIAQSWVNSVRPRRERERLSGTLVRFTPGPKCRADHRAALTAVLKSISPQVFTTEVVEDA
jgi:hypothetical protein